MKEKTEKPCGKTHLLQLIDVSSCSDDFECIPSKLETTSSVLRQQPSKLNPCRNVCYLYVLTKEQGKETRALQEKISPRLLITSWQKKDVWKTLFQNKSSGTINPVYLPRKTPEHYKERVNQQNTVNHNSCPRFLSYNLGGTSHEQP